MSRAQAVTCDGCGRTVARPIRGRALPPGWISFTLWPAGKRVDVCAPMCGARVLELSVDPDTVPIEARLRAVES